MSDITPAKDTEILRILRERNGTPSTVALTDGQTLTVLDIAWGYDLGDAFAHVTTNISPGAAGQPIDTFRTEHVLSIIDPATSEVLFDNGQG